MIFCFCEMFGWDVHASPFHHCSSIHKSHDRFLLSFCHHYSAVIVNIIVMVSLVRQILSIYAHYISGQSRKPRPLLTSWVCDWRIMVNGN